LAAGEIFGGAERQILSLLRYLRCRSVNATLLVFNDGALVKLARQNGIETVVLNAHNSAVNLRALRCLRRELINRRIQVLHIHGYKAAVYGALAQQGLAITTIRTEHGMIESSGRGLERLRPKFYRLLENVAGQITRTTFAYVTNDLRKRCLGEHANGRGVVIYNGIESSEITLSDAPPSEFEPGHLHLVIAGRLEAVKGIETAITAMTDEHMPAHARLHIVGSGPLMGDLQRQVTQLKVDDRVRFLGFRTDVYNLIGHAGALLMPSLHEGLPYTLLEAMVLETPVLASAVGGLAEVIQDGRTGLLFPPSKPASIAAAVQTLASNPTLAEQLAKRALADVKERFSLEMMGEQYLRLYMQASAEFTATAPPYPNDEGSR
jgi:glycosyltransferase involved in cell wall biosynthesis